MPGSIGEAFVEIRPDTSAFERSLQSNLPTSLNRVGQNLSVPVKANTSQWEADWVGATTRVKERFGRIFEYAAIGGGLYGAFDAVKTGLQGVEQEAQQARQATIVFGQDGGKALQKWSDNSVSALGLTKGATLETVNQLGNMLRGFGDKDSLPDAEALTTRIRQIADAQGKSFEEVQSTFIEDLKSGRTAALRELIPDINDAAIKEQAEKMGLITTSVNDPKVNKMRADLKVLGDEIARTQKGDGTTDPRALEIATERLHQAENQRGEDIKRYGKARESSVIAVQQAEKTLADLKNPGGMSEAEKQDKVNQLKADYLVLQQQIDDAQKGSLDNLDQNIKALASAKLSLQDTANLPAPSGPAFDVEKTDAAFKTAEEHLATGLLPQVEKFSDWVGHHGTDINHFADKLGQFLGTAADAAGTLIKWFTDHPDAGKEIGITLGSAFAIKKLHDWGGTAATVLKDVAKVGKGTADVIGKIFGGDFKGAWERIFGGGAKGAAPTATMSVGEMTVGTLIAKSMIGGPGGPLNREPGGPPVPGPNGEPMPSSSTPTTESTGPTGEAVGNGYRNEGADYNVTKASEGVKGPNYRLGGSEGGGRGTGAAGVGAAVALSVVAADTAHERSDAKSFAKQLQDPNSAEYQRLVGLFEGTKDQQAQGFRDIADHMFEADTATNNLLGQELVDITNAAKAQHDYIGSTGRLFDAIVSDYSTADARIAALEAAQRALSKQTTGRLGAELNAGVGSVNLGRQTFRSTAIGGWFDVPTPVVVGDAPSGGEAVLNSPQLHAVVAGAVASALAASAARGTAQGMVFSPTLNGVGMEEIKAVMEREFYRFMRLWNDNQQRGLPPMHGFSSS